MIEIIRVDQDDVRTLGSLLVDKRLICFTLELPWRDNQRGKSCIPAETYSFKKYKSKQFNRECIGLLSVEGRDYIAIHPGNTPDQTKGCILPGLKLEGDAFVLHSLLALQRILSKINEDSGTLIIRNELLRG